MLVVERRHRPARGDLAVPFHDGTLGTLRQCRLDPETFARLGTVGTDPLRVLQKGADGHEADSSRDPCAGRFMYASVHVSSDRSDRSNVVVQRFSGAAVRDDPGAVEFAGADDVLARRDIGRAMDTLVAARWYLNRALEDGEEIPEIVKTHMRWADCELDLSITGLKTFLGAPGVTPP